MARRARSERSQRGDPLHESIGVAEEAVFVRHDLQTRGDDRKFTAGEQKVGRAGRPTLSLPAAKVSQEGCRRATAATIAGKSGRQR